MGGGYSLDLALNDPEAEGGRHQLRPSCDRRRVAEEDQRVDSGNLWRTRSAAFPPADVNKFEAQLKALGKTVEIHIFPDAGHAFENPNNKQSYRAGDAAQAWKLTVDFLAKYLK